MVKASSVRGGALSTPDYLNVEPRYVCQGSDYRGADVRPNFEQGNTRIAIEARIAANKP